MRPSYFDSVLNPQLILDEFDILNWRRLRSFRTSRSRTLFHMSPHIAALTESQTAFGTSVRFITRMVIQMSFKMMLFRERFRTQRARERLNTWKCESVIFLLTFECYKMTLTYQSAAACAMSCSICPRNVFRKKYKHKAFLRYESEHVVSKASSSKKLFRKTRTGVVWHLKTTNFQKYDRSNRRALHYAKSGAFCRRARRQINELVTWQMKNAHIITELIWI